MWSGCRSTLCTLLSCGLESRKVWVFFREKQVLLCESDDQQCHHHHQQQQHMMKNMTITCLNLTQICISIVHHQFWFYKGAVTLGPFLPCCTNARMLPSLAPPHAVTLTVQRPSAYSLGWHIPGATPSLQVCLDVVAAAWTHSSHFKWLCGAWAQHMLVWLCPTLCKGLCSCEQLVY